MTVRSTVVPRPRIALQRRLKIAPAESVQERFGAQESFESIHLPDFRSTARERGAKSLNENSHVATRTRRSKTLNRV